MLGAAYGLVIAQATQRLLPPLHVLSLARAALRLAGLHLALLALLVPVVVWLWGQANAQQGLAGAFAFGTTLVVIVLMLGQALGSRVTLAQQSAKPRKQR